MSDQTKLSTADWLQSEKVRQKIEQALPGGHEAKRFLQCLFTQVQVTPKLLQCSKSSLQAAMIKCAQVGIEPDGRRAHLIPYGQTCQVIVDYKGLIELAFRSGKIELIHADVVRENDQFEHNMGEIRRHTYDLGRDRGEITGAYAYCKFKAGHVKSEVMSLDEIEVVRSRSRSGSSGPWKTDYAEMCKKTATRRLAKWLPLSPEERDIIHLDDDQFEGMKRAKPSLKSLMEAAEDSSVDPDGAELLEEGPQEAAEEARKEYDDEGL